MGRPGEEGTHGSLDICWVPRLVAGAAGQAGSLACGIASHRIATARGGPLGSFLLTTRRARAFERVRRRPPFAARLHSTTARAARAKETLGSVDYFPSA